MAQRFALQAEARATAGTGISRSLRRDGKVPGILYGGGGEDVKVAVNCKELTKEYSKGGFFSKLVDLKIGTQNLLALPRDIQFHPVTDVITHIDFQRVAKDSKIHVFVPVQFINADKCIGVKRGGILNAVRREVELVCTPDNIPDVLIADVANLNIGGSIHISDVKLPEGVKPAIHDRNFTIATIASSKGMQEETAVVAAAAEGDAAAAPAAGAAAPAAGKAAPAAAGKAAPAAAGKAAPAAAPAKKK